MCWHKFHKSSKKHKDVDIDKSEILSPQLVSDEELEEAHTLVSQEVMRWWTSSNRNYKARRTESERARKTCHEQVVKKLGDL